MSLREWIRANGDRVALVVAGIVVFAVAVAISEQQAFASSLAVLAVGSFVLAVILPRVRSFTLGAKGIDARLNRIEQKIDGLAIRTALANLVAEGDRVSNGLSLAEQMVLDDLNNQREPTYDRTVWQQVGEWIAEVRTYIRETPGLGEADAILFDTHGSGPPMKLKLPERFDETIAFVRERQDRIRDLIKRFE